MPESRANRADCRIISGFEFVFRCCLKADCIQRRERLHRDGTCWKCFPINTSFKKMTTEDASQQSVRSSILRHVLLGFHPASLEERFQQEQVKGAKATDLLANTFWSVISSIVAWNLLRHPKLPGGDLLSTQNCCRSYYVVYAAIRARLTV